MANDLDFSSLLQDTSFVDPDSIGGPRKSDWIDHSGLGDLEFANEVLGYGANVDPILQLGFNRFLDSQGSGNPIDYELISNKADPNNPANIAMQNWARDHNTNVPPAALRTIETDPWKQDVIVDVDHFGPYAHDRDYMNDVLRHEYRHLGNYMLEDSGFPIDSHVDKSFPNIGTNGGYVKEEAFNKVLDTMYAKGGTTKDIANDYLGTLSSYNPLDYNSINDLIQEAESEASQLINPQKESFLDRALNYLVRPSGAADEPPDFSLEEALRRQGFDPSQIVQRGTADIVNLEERRKLAQLEADHAALQDIPQDDIDNFNRTIGHDTPYRYGPGASISDFAEKYNRVLRSPFPDPINNLDRTSERIVRAVSGGDLPPPEGDPRKRVDPWWKDVARYGKRLGPWGLVADYIIGEELGGQTSLSHGLDVEKLLEGTKKEALAKGYTEDEANKHVAEVALKAPSIDKFLKSQTMMDIPYSVDRGKTGELEINPKNLPYFYEKESKFYKEGQREKDEASAQRAKEDQERKDDSDARQAKEKEEKKKRKKTVKKTESEVSKALKQSTAPKVVKKVIKSKKVINDAVSRSRGDVKSAVTIALTHGDVQRAWAKQKKVDPSTVYGSTLRKTAGGGWTGGF